MAIYGVEVCQLCGRVDSFCGMAAALGSHFPMNSPASEFVCRDCRARLKPPGSTAHHPLSVAVTAKLDAQRHRFCGVCAAPMERPWARLGRIWLCAPCHGWLLDQITRTGGRVEPRELVTKRLSGSEDAR